MSQSLFHFHLTAGAVQIVDRPPIFGQRDEPAGHALASLVLRNKLREQLRKRSGILLDDAFFEGLDRAFEEARAEGRRLSPAAALATLLP